MTETETDTAGSAVEGHGHGLPAMTSTDLALLPGEVSPHPTPVKYVMIAVALVIITAAEVGMYYLEGELPNWAISLSLICMAILKFFTVVAWYMHLKTDRVIFRRFFVLGIVAAITLYLAMLASLDVFV